MSFRHLSVSAEDDAEPRRRTAPGVRAIAGGVLVACAMLGVLVAPGGAEEADRSYVVTAVDLAPGEPIVPSMLRTLTMTLPPAVARPALSAVSASEGLVARVAIPAGSLLHSDLLSAEPADLARGPEVTIAVPVRRALGGALSVGDSLDVVATYGTGTEGFSQVVAAAVVVTDVVDTDDALGVEPAVTVTVRLVRGGDVLPVVHASHADALSLVLGVDGTAGSEGSFRPTSPDAEEIQ